MNEVAERDLLTALREVAGPDAVNTDPADLEYYGQDVFTVRRPPLAIFRPTSVEMLADGIAAATRSGLVVVPRGGGMSYTSGYLAGREDAILVDTGALNRILSIDETDMTITVEAGCTWASIYAALHPKGLRLPAWGTLSGLHATVGGGMSQNGLFWGSARGTIAPTALTIDVVLADGTILSTGNETVRPFGPDLTGLFTADCGALGVKARITLPLVRDAAGLAYGSFALDSREAFAAALSEIGRAGLATECFGFDPVLQASRMKRDSVLADAKTLVGVMKAQGGFWKGLKEGAKIAAAGRSFLDDANYSIHTISEGRNQAAADADLAAITAIVAAAGGRPVENTIPKVMRANPFPPVNTMVGPSGERWVASHGIVRHSRALETMQAIDALYDSHAEAMDRLDVGAGFLFLALGTTGFLIEPIYYWPDAMQAMHHRSIEPAHLARLTHYPAGPEARALVDTLRAGLIEIFGRMDAAHMQIGRTYPIAERADPAAWGILTAIKAKVDPARQMNPGVLGL